MATGISQFSPQMVVVVKSFVHLRYLEFMEWKIDMPNEFSVTKIVMGLPLGRILFVSCCFYFLQSTVDYSKKCF